MLPKREKEMRLNLGHEKLIIIVVKNGKAS